ncbi:cytochrome P460 family protein [Bradyrhizobium liaoningense]|nr:cytochrome P460 family protein [Bradyrhizobium liaoningense]MBR0858282.1 cytochrome P460 family protein [Bradyrhizobium liaoningense]
MRAVGTTGVAILTVVGIAFAIQQSSLRATEPNAGSASTAAVDTEGHLRVPPDYWANYQSLGSWAIAADDGRGSKELHVVYASPGTIDAYRRDKRFPDGAVLIKEVFRTATGDMTTGTVSRAGALKGWFVMVKDSANRHAGNPLWGDGWGWSWFDATDPAKTTSTDYKVDCQSCHVPAQASDWVYVDGYPALKR